MKKPSNFLDLSGRQILDSTASPTIGQSIWFYSVNVSNLKKDISFEPWHFS